MTAASTLTIDETIVTPTSHSNNFISFYNGALAFVDSISSYHKPILSLFLAATIQILVNEHRALHKPYVQIDDIIDIQANQTVGTIDKYYPDFEISFEVKVNGNLTSNLHSSIQGFLEMNSSRNETGR